MAGKKAPPDGSDRDAEREEQQEQEADRKPLPRRFPDCETGKRDDQEQRSTRTLSLTV